jgi:predicted phage gp36 major capsid-like protein
MTRDELRAELAEARSRVQEIDSNYAGQYLDPDSDDGREWAERNERIDELNRTLEQLERREQRLRELADEPANREDGTTFHTPRPNATRGEDIYDLSTVRSSISDPSQQRGELRDRARRAIETSRPRHPGIDADTARSNVERLVEENDTEDGRFARYLLAVGSPAYRRAFGHYLQRGDASGMSREEQVAWQLGQTAERALSLTGATGGFAVPFELDPTILNTSNGVVNPIRQIANVEQITVDEWRGVSSSGITASYAAEATETTDNSPTLVQPTISSAAFIGDLLILNRIRQFDTVGSSAAIWADTLQADVPARLLGKPAYEASAMPDDATTGNKFLVFGDFSRYKIVDRVGLTVEVIPHLFGTNQRPTGQRGLYAYWRNGAKVVDGNAFRAILGTA